MHLYSQALLLSNVLVPTSQYPNIYPEHFSITILRFDPLRKFQAAKITCPNIYLTIFTCLLLLIAMILSQVRTASTFIPCEFQYWHNPCNISATIYGKLIQPGKTLFIQAFPISHPFPSIISIHQSGKLSTCCIDKMKNLFSIEEIHQY